MTALKASVDIFVAGECGEAFYFFWEMTMPSFTFSTSVNKDPRSVFGVIRDVKKYPQFMNSLKSLKVLKGGKKNILVSEWQVDIDGTPIEWTQEDTIDEKAMTVTFKSIKGDYSYEGTWKVAPAGDGSQVTLSAVFDWQVPNFEKYYGKVYEKKARISVKSMLMAIKRRALHG